MRAARTDAAAQAAETGRRTAARPSGRARLSVRPLCGGTGSFDCRQTVRPRTRGRATEAHLRMGHRLRGFGPRDVWNDVRKHVKGQMSSRHTCGGDRLQQADGAKCVARVPQGAQATEVEAWVSTPVPRERQDPGSGRLPSRALERVETSRMSTLFGGSRRFAAATAVTDLASTYSAQAG